MQTHVFLVQSMIAHATRNGNNCNCLKNKLNLNFRPTGASSDNVKLYVTDFLVYAQYSHTLEPRTGFTCGSRLTSQVKQHCEAVLQWSLSQTLNSQRANMHTHIRLFCLFLQG